MGRFECLKCNFARGRLSFHHRSARECHSLWVFVSFHVYKSPRTRQVRAAMRALLSRSVGPSRDYRGINLPCAACPMCAATMQRDKSDSPPRRAQATTGSLCFNKVLTRLDSFALVNWLSPVSEYQLLLPALLALSLDFSGPTKTKLVRLNTIAGCWLVTCHSHLILI